MLHLTLECISVRMKVLETAHHFSKFSKIFTYNFVLWIISKYVL